MCHQRLDVDQTRGDEADRLGVLFRVPVLVFQVDLVRGEMHEGDGLQFAADADDEYESAEFHALRGMVGD